MLNAHLVTQLWFSYLSELLSADISITAAVELANR